VVDGLHITTVEDPGGLQALEDIEIAANEIELFNTETKVKGFNMYVSNLQTLN
jgi:hypothetical protein